jgi:hypothetical protein
MALKYALLALALFVVWMVLFRATRGGAPTKPTPPAPLPQDLKPCPRCGVYRLPSGACDCDPQSASRN